MRSGRYQRASSLGLFVGLLLILLQPARGMAKEAIPLDFTLASDTGRSEFITLSDLPAQTTVINFWRYDCPPCIEELPRLAALAQKGLFRLVTVAVHRTSENRLIPDALMSALATPTLAFHAPAEPAGLLRRFGDASQALPYTAVLRADRTLCASQRGTVSDAWIHTGIRRCE